MGFELNTAGMTAGDKAAMFREAMALKGGTLGRALIKGHEDERQAAIQELLVEPLIDCDPVKLYARVMELRGRVAAQKELFEAVEKILSERETNGNGNT